LIASRKIASRKLQIPGRFLALLKAERLLARLKAGSFLEVSWSLGRFLARLLARRIKPERLLARKLLLATTKTTITNSPTSLPPL
jgi:hypothetical protein